MFPVGCAKAVIESTTFLFSIIDISRVVRDSNSAREEAERRLSETREQLGQLEKKYNALHAKYEQHCDDMCGRGRIIGGNAGMSMGKSGGEELVRNHEDRSGSQRSLWKTRRRHTVSEMSSKQGDDDDSKFSGSLGLWFLLAHNMTTFGARHRVGSSSSHGSSRLEESTHLTTVSVANDGRSSVGTAAAAAVSIALAKSWTSVSIASENSRSGKQDIATPMGSEKMNVPRAKFRLVAALPKGPGKLFREGQSINDCEHDGIPIDHLDPKEETTTEWAAYGAHLKLEWMSKPKRVLIVFKPSDDAFSASLKAIKILLKENLFVYVEPKFFDRVTAGLKGDSDMDDSDILSRLSTWTCDRCKCSDTIPEDIGSSLDLICTVGGDGTVLWGCSLLGTVGSVPPIVAISMGSLGFMTPFPVSRLEKTILNVISPKSEVPLMLRHRLQCRIIRADASKDGFNLTDEAPCGEDVMVLNEVVINRGVMASLTKLECYIDGNYVTIIQGDGLIVSTPTGSTAYNLAAGGSMVHPAVPCILFTPICPHTLSSRPLVFPEHVVLRLKVPSDSKDDLFCSFDGKARKPLCAGDSVLVYSCQSPVPMACHLDASHDWFTSVKEGLDWNRRTVQKQGGNLVPRSSKDVHD